MVLRHLGDGGSLVEHLVALGDLSDHLFGGMALGLHVVVVLHFHSGGPDSHSGWTGLGGAPHGTETYPMPGNVDALVAVEIRFTDFANASGSSIFGDSSSTGAFCT